MLVIASVVVQVGLYRNPKKFSGNYIENSGKKYGDHGVEIPSTLDPVDTVDPDLILQGLAVDGWGRL